MMKKARVLFAGLPLLFLAAGVGHQAFGPLRFGMPTAAARTAKNHITQSYLIHHRDTLTAADVRAQFVTNGSLRVAKNAALEASFAVYMLSKGETAVTEVSVDTRSRPAEEYGTTVRQMWEVFQDIGDGKFVRKEPKGQFPPVEILAMDNPAVAKSTFAEVVTDTWECEGVRIELVVTMLPPGGVTASGLPRPAPSYNVKLRATEMDAKP